MRRGIVMDERDEEMMGMGILRRGWNH